MSDTPTDPSTPNPESVPTEAVPTDTVPTEFAPTEPVAATNVAADTPPPAAPAAPAPTAPPLAAPSGPPLGPPAGPPVGGTPMAAEPPARRTWLRNGLIAAAAVVLAGLIFSAGVAVGWVSGGFDRFDRFDRSEPVTKFDEVFGDSDRRDRRDRIEECFFGDEDGSRDDSCPPFMREDSGWFDEGSRNERGERGDRGERLPMPVQPRDPDDRGSSSSDQAVIVYPDGRVVPLTPNDTTPDTTMPAPVPVVPETIAPTGP